MVCGPEDARYNVLLLRMLDAAERYIALRVVNDAKPSRAVLAAVEGTPLGWERKDAT